MRLRDIDMRWLASLCFVGVCAVAVAYLALRWLPGALLPFGIAWGIALAVRPVSVWLRRKTRLPYKVCSVISALLALGLAGTGVYLLIGTVVREAGDAVSYISENPDVIRGVYDKIAAFGSKIANIFLPDRASGSVAVQGGTLLGELMELLRSVAGWLVVKLPGAVIFIFVTLIATVYFAWDLDKINASVKSILPAKMQPLPGKLRSGIFGIAGRFAGAYLILMGVTCVLLALGFVILGIRYPLLLAVLFSVLDLLPVIGVGTLLLPWGLYCLATGSTGLGMGLLAVYLVCAVCREFLESRLLGGRFGIHPLMMLVLLYGGIKLWGIVGMIIGPLIGILLRSLWVSRSDKEYHSTAVQSPSP